MQPNLQLAPIHRSGNSSNEKFFGSRLMRLRISRDCFWLPSVAPQLKPMPRCWDRSVLACLVPSTYLVGTQQVEDACGPSTSIRNYSKVLLKGFF